MYMELVFNIYEELDVTLRALHLAVSGGSWKAARQHLQAALSVLETTLGYATANFWPHTVTAAFLSQVLYYVCASWLNMLLSTRTVCSKASAREMQSWVADVEAWFASPKHAAFRDECSSELAPFRQALSLLTTDKEALGKGDVEQNRAKFAALTSNQVRMVVWPFFWVSLNSLVLLPLPPRPVFCWKTPKSQTNVCPRGYCACSRSLRAKKMLTHLWTRLACTPSQWQLFTPPLLRI